MIIVKTPIASQLLLLEADILLLKKIITCYATVTPRITSYKEAGSPMPIKCTNKNTPQITLSPWKSTPEVTERQILDGGEGWREYWHCEDGDEIRGVADDEDQTTQPPPCQYQPYCHLMISLMPALTHQALPL
ncbi:hypothetical protein Pcinc_005704 [Petrolisthes cinctipes]|uniref:Uncharacterized protein n=1 Tax=Petrolisthes cinctipes TaxID=88211 RepID=A0AAE1GCX2_PETCI|nr:hypothetical protein Pcinc_005704 [Petrolisthes cinctipes]